MLETYSYLYWLIVGCEVGFWLALLAALTTRYLLNRERLSKMLMLAMPLLDLLLLVFTVLDLRAGVSATFAHGLAAAYVGFTIAFGPLAIVWADQHFAFHFARGPSPDQPPDERWPAVRYELRLWVRCIFAAIIIMALLAGMIAFVDNDSQTEALRYWFRVAFGMIFFWFIFGPVWTLLLFKRRVGESA